MTRLPSVSGRAVVKALERAGFELDRRRGSHMILRETRPPHRRLTVPDHRELGRGLLRSLIRQAGLTVDEFLDLLR